MKRYIYIIAAMLSITLLATGCNRADQTQETDSTGIPIEFSTNLDIRKLAPAATQQASTRVMGDNFEIGDQVGIYMMLNTQTLSDASIVLGAKNSRYIVSFVATGDAQMTHDPIGQEKPLHYYNAATDFIAYYPHRDDVTADYKINVNTGGDQSQSGGNQFTKADILWSGNATGINAHDKVSFQFEHRMSKMEINIARTLELSNTSVIISEVWIEGMNTEGYFSLANGSFDKTTAKAITNITPVKLSTVVSPFDASYEAIVLPQDAADGRKVKISMSNNKVYEYTIPSTQTFAQGSSAQLDITVGRLEVESAIITVGEWKT